jgi:hypothetical protein
MSLARHRRTRIAAAAAASFAPHRLFQANEQGFVFEAENPDKLLKRRNLLTYSQDFSNAAWVKTAATLVTGAADPIGGTTATTWTATAALTRLYQQPTASPGRPGTFTVYLRRVSGAASYDLSVDGIAFTPIAITSSWARFSVTLAATPSSLFPQVRASAASGDVLEVWGGQFEFAASATDYQKVTDWTTEYRDAVASLCSMWQDSAGTTPVTAVEQPVGLWLDKRLGMVKGSELITVAADRNFTSNTGFWSKSAGVTIGSGAASTATQFDGISKAAVSGVTAGGLYEVTFTVLSGSSIKVQLFGNSGVYRGVGTWTQYLLAGSSGSAVALYFDGVGGGSITGVSIRQVLGNHATQATSSSRPTLSARVNLLTKTEQLTDAAWTKGANVAISAGATTGSTRVTVSGAANTVFASATGIGAVSTRGRFKVKSISGSAWLMLTVYDGTNGYRSWINISTGAAGTHTTIGSGATAVSLTTSIDSGSTVTVSAIGTCPNNNPFVQFQPVTADAATVASNATFDISELDLRTADDAAKHIPAYQRVNTSTDYDTEGFSHVDRFDGVDDGISTPVFSAGTLTSNMDFFIVIKMRAAAQMAIASNGPTAAQFIGVTTSGAGTAGHAGVGSAWTTFVNGTQVGGLNSTTRGDLYTALATNEWKVLEVRNLDLSAWTQFTLGSYTSYMLNADVAGVVLVPAQSHLRRMQIRRYLASKVGMVLHT